LRKSPRERRWSRHFVKPSTKSCPAYDEKLVWDWCNTTAHGATAGGMRVEYKKPLVWPREGSYATRPGAGVTGKPSRNEISYIQANLGGFRGRSARWAPDPVRDPDQGLRLSATGVFAGPGEPADCHRFRALKVPPGTPPRNEAGAAARRGSFYIKLLPWTGQWLVFEWVRGRIDAVAHGARPLAVRA
jgi:hypothetical protein